MANPDHVAKLIAGMNEWHHWRATSGVVSPDLTGADLSASSLLHTPLMKNRRRVTRATLSEAGTGADFRGFDFSAADLRRADLGMADLSGANLSGAELAFAMLARVRLDGANMTHAKLQLAQLTRASAQRVDFRYADLSYTVFSGADLQDARFTDAMMNGCVLTDTDLSRVQGLDAVLHAGPSSLGVDTIRRSRGQFPREFLRGIGLSNELIELIRNVNVSPSQFTSCFISYSNADTEFAERLHADLQARGVRCWFAPHEMVGGGKLDTQIETAIREYERLLLVVSEHSMSSEWVKHEVLRAREKERQIGGRVLFPISLIPFAVVQTWRYVDPDTGEDIGRLVREYFIPDFTHWRSDPAAYNTAFDKLLKGLKANDAPKHPK